jgi:hypothetical protein
MENLNLQERNYRLFGYLDEVLSVSQKKFRMEKASNATRQKWGRLMVQAIGTYAKVLEISALDQLEERIRILEQSPQPRDA